MEHWGWLEPREVEDLLWARQFGGGGGQGDNDNDNNGNNTNGDDDDDNNNNGGGGGGQRFGGFGGFGRNSTFRFGNFGNRPRFNPGKSIRTSTVILSVFNVVAAFATAVGIIWEGYATTKRNNPKFRFRTSAFSCIGSPEIFPLVLSCGIVIQGIVFAVAQSTGLKGTQVLGCTVTSQMMLPAVFIVPYIQLVFGLEVALRALRRHNPFPPPRKWSVMICMAVVGTFLLITYLVTHFYRPPNFCFASLFWFVQSYKLGCFAILTIIAVALFAASITIFVKLHRHAAISPTERITASRMVYYLTVGFISTSLYVPFFAYISFIRARGANNTALQLSMVASVVANVSGLMTGGLHLFLRSSSSLATIGPRDKQGKDDDDERKDFKRGIRMWTPQEDSGAYSTTNLAPMNGPGSLRRMDTDDSLTGSDDGRSYAEEKEYWDDRVNPLRSHAVFPTTTASALRSPESAQVQPSKSGYSLFPSNNSVKVPSLLPATAYDPSAKEMMASSNTLKPPAPIHGFRHRRDSSLASHTTVQIGLRLSNVDDVPPLDSKYFHDGNKVHNLECPLAVGKTNGLVSAARPSPLSQVTRDSTNNGSDDDDESVTIYNDDAHKNGADHDDKECKDCMLSPAVYKPPSSPKATRAKVTSPRGVGFNVPPPRSNSSSTQDAAPSSTQAKKAAWI